MVKHNRKKKDEKVYQEPDEAAAEEAAKASGGLKPVKKAKVKKIMRSAAAVAEEAEQAVAAKEQAVQEQEIEMDEEDVPRVGRAVWVEVPEGVDTFTMDHARKVMRTVGEVENVSVVKPYTFQVAFSTVGPVRRALMLHNKPFSQLPFLSDRKLATFDKHGKAPEAATPEKKPASQPPATPATPSPFTDSTHRLSVDLPLPAENRVYVGGVPHGCSNSEVARALAHFGKIAYVYRNNYQSYGFAAFKAPASVKRAVEEEVVIIRGNKISIKRYEKSTSEGGRRWQVAQTTEALQYLRSLVPFNPYVLSSPGSAPIAAQPAAASVQQRSPFTLTPMAPPKLELEGKKAVAAAATDSAAKSPQAAAKGAKKRKAAAMEEDKEAAAPTAADKAPAKKLKKKKQK